MAKPNDEVIVIGPLEGPKLLRGHVIVNPKAEIALREIRPIPPERASFVGRDHNPGSTQPGRDETNRRHR